MACSLYTVLLILCFVQAQNVSTSRKRGLVYIWTEDASEDDIWQADGSPLTWYYNYGAYPSSGIDGSKLNFVPMMWGDRDEDLGFHNTVKSLIDSGSDVRYVLGFNEPDGCEGGGSCVDAQKAAKLWKQEIEPLKQYGVQLGAPAVRGGGSAWLQEFYSYCNGKCTTDFMPAHWYGDSIGLAGWVDYLNTTYQNMTVWVTEFAYPAGPLLATQQAFNDSLAFLDAQSYITHYSYFGTFRSDAANDFVGPNVAMLNRGGLLTNIGAWYLGKRATGVGPKTDTSTSTRMAGWNPTAIAGLLSLILLYG